METVMLPVKQVLITALVVLSRQPVIGKTEIHGGSNMLIKMLSVFLGVFFGASLLSGSSITCSSWYSAPAELSRLFISIIVPISLMFFIKWFLCLFIGKK